MVATLSTLKRTRDNFPKMKVRGKRRKLERIAAARYARFGLAMVMLGQSMNQMGMVVRITNEALDQFMEANRMDKPRGGGRDWGRE